MALTDIKIRQAKPADKPFKIADSHGLYLEVRPNGSKFWRYRYRINKAENVFAIGKYPDMTLQQARAERDEARNLVKKGMHPAHLRQSELVKQIISNENSFENVAREWHSKMIKKWKPAYQSQVISCLEKNVFPVIGPSPIMRLSKSGAPQILLILQRMEKRGAEAYAMMTRQWMSSIFCYAAQTLRAEGDPAALFKGLIDRSEIKHSSVMKAGDIKELKDRLGSYRGNPTTIIAFWLLLRTFVRTKELCHANWSEFNDDLSEWVIPKERMKMNRRHVVPLSRQAREALLELKSITGSGHYLFPNVRRPEAAMSNTTINRAFENMGYAPTTWTGHDFRSTASTHLHEMGFRPDVIELQLAHVETNKTKAAYNHAEYLPERRELMQSWSDWIDGV